MRKSRSASNPSSPNNSNPGMPVGSNGGQHQQQRLSSVGNNSDSGGGGGAGGTASQLLTRRSSTAQLNELLASISTTKRVVWQGAMSFDVNSARLQYTRVTVGDNDIPINVGDTVLFVHSSGSAVGVNVGRVQNLFHNPRGKSERTAKIAVSTQFSDEPASPLSRLMLNLDEVPAAGHVMRSTTVETPVVNVLGKVEVRNSDGECGSCVACFLRHTPGVSAANACVDWTMVPMGASQIEGGVGPPVLITDTRLRDAVVELNSFLLRSKSQLPPPPAPGGEPHSPVSSNSSLGTARRKVLTLEHALVDRLTELLKTSLPQHQVNTCQACKAAARSSVLLTQSSQQSQTQQQQNLSEMVVQLLPRLALVDLIREWEAVSVAAPEQEESEHAMAMYQQQQQQQQQQTRDVTPPQQRQQKPPRSDDDEDCEGVAVAADEEEEEDSSATKKKRQHQNGSGSALRRVSGKGNLPHRRERTGGPGGGEEPANNISMSMVAALPTAQQQQSAPPPPQQQQQQQQQQVVAAPPPPPPPPPPQTKQVFTDPSLVAAGFDTSFLRLTGPLPTLQQQQQQ